MNNTLKDLIKKHCEKGLKWGHSLSVEDILDHFHMESFQFYRIGCPRKHVKISINKKMI